MIARLLRRSNAILLQVCPACERGKLFKGILEMRAECQVCHLRFEREEGYWTGAMMINWLLVCVTLGPVWVIMLVRGVPFMLTLMLTALALVLLLPIYFRYSRVIWLYMDHSIDTEKR